MKHYFTVLILAAAAIINVAAKDIVILRNGDEIEAVVESISDDDISYRKASNPGGPLYHIEPSDVFMIKYANGSKDVFEATKKVEKSESTPAAIADYPYPPVTKKYAIGDYFNEGGVKGLVFFVDETGEHGLIINTEYYDEHGNSFTDIEEEWGATDKNDGWYNMQMLRNFCDENSIDLKKNMFALYQMDEKLSGSGWYIPSLNEALLIVKARNGGQLWPRDKDAKKRFDKAYKSQNRKSFDPVNIFTSTENGNNQMLIVSGKDGKRGYTGKKDELILSGLILTSKNPVSQIYFIHKF